MMPLGEYIGIDLLPGIARIMLIREREDMYPVLLIWWCDDNKDRAYILYSGSGSGSGSGSEEQTLDV